ncbi:DUF1801 domain-containing protein [uncultured Mucilaginibacter sp.]|uniref:YdeI/OmpD-associated family protein n=1 Tax=uncultured Mucilaginibacter sp. TaxID=797541 RepID=UPI0025E1F0A7|nr:DUF1801 domain-containing protein [uncultured Mucilaginibacter sp.]
MSQTDIRIDDYITKSAEFAQPVLIHLRTLVHQACSQIQETIKWSMPFFEYKGTVCNMAAFKQHCTFGFWKGKLLPDPHGILNMKDENAMGQLGRITGLSDLPPDEVLIQYIKEAIALNENGVKVEKAKPATKADLVIPDYFIDFLNQHPKAAAQFNQYGYSHQKEYVQWITEAKTETTRLKRMQTSVEWLSEGKSRNWKYQK